MKSFEFLNNPIPITEQSWSDETKPYLTIRTITFNHEKFIRKCIEGILMQKTTFPVKLIIHDDASADKTGIIIKEFQSRYSNLIKVIIQENNTYGKADRVEMMKPYFNMIEGKYIAICEGDDYWIDSLKLQKQVEILDNNEGLNVCVTGHSILFNNTGELVVKNIQNISESVHAKGFEFDLLDLQKNWITQTCTCVYRNVINLYDLAKTHKQFIDIHLFYYLLKGSKGFYLSENTSVYRVHEGGISSMKTGQVNVNANFNANFNLYELNQDEFTRFETLKSSMALLCFDLYHKYESNTFAKKMKLLKLGISLAKSFIEYKIVIFAFVPEKMKSKYR